jgi:transposase
MPNIPPKANRKWKNCFSPFLYRNRNAIERMFCRLKDRAGVACLDSAPRKLSGFLPGYAERGAERFCRGVGRA